MKLACPLNVSSFLLRIKSVSGKVPFRLLEQQLGVENLRKALHLSAIAYCRCDTNLSSLLLSFSQWFRRGRDSFFLWWKFLLENKWNCRSIPIRLFWIWEKHGPASFLEPMRCSVSGCKVIPLKIVCKGKDPSGEHGQVLYKTLQPVKGTEQK